MEMKPDWLIKRIIFNLLRLGIFFTTFYLLGGFNPEPGDLYFKIIISSLVALVLLIRQWTTVPPILLFIAFCSTKVNGMSSEGLWAVRSIAVVYTIAVFAIYLEQIQDYEENNGGIFKSSLLPFLGIELLVNSYAYALIAF